MSCRVRDNDSEGQRQGGTEKGTAEKVEGSERRFHFRGTWHMITVRRVIETQ